MSASDYYQERATRLEELSGQYDQEKADLESSLKRLRNGIEKIAEVEKAALRKRIHQIEEEYKCKLNPANLSATTPFGGGLAVDTMIWARQGCPRSEDARKWYIDIVRSLTLDLPEELDIDKRPLALLPGWFVIEVDFILESPWYSKDDCPLHLLDNPVRKDRVFGVPYMSAASWKGLLRWACRMEEGLLQYLDDNKMSMAGWQDEPWIIHLFGNERAAAEDFSQGALVFYPTWFSKIGFELINPHSRKTRAGTVPILYEVVPSDVAASLRLLYAPLPAQHNELETEDTLRKLPYAIEKLLTRYGFSAKRTAGWGKAKIDKWRIRGYNKEPKEADSAEEFANMLSELLPVAGQKERGGRP